MNMFMLAEITEGVVNNADPDGMLCLASILFAVIVIAIYCLSGFIGGSYICFFLWVFAVCLAENAIGGIPLWVYHPASPCWIFGIGGSPMILFSCFVASKLC